MIRKIIYAALSVAIIITGYIAFGRLNYWERSKMIFTADLSENQGGRGRGGFEGRRGMERGDFEGRPGVARGEFVGRGRFGSAEDRQMQFERNDSLGRRNFEGRGRLREMPDSIRANGIRESFRRGDFADSLRRNTAGFAGERGDQRQDFRRGGHGSGSGRIYLRNVWYFLAVFAAFTVVIICIDNIIRFLKKKTVRKQG